MKILLTGATGFIGSHLRRRLSKKYEVVALVRKSTHINALTSENISTLTIPDSISELSDQLKYHRIDGVLHLASLYLKSHKPDQVEELVSSNILLPAQLLEASVTAQVKWFLNTGTFWQHYRDENYSPVNLYAATKQAFIAMAQYYAETSALKFVTLKLSDTFGPGDTRKKVFNLWQDAVQTGETLKMSPGDQIIDISYIDIICDAYEALINILITNPHSLNSEYAVSSNERMSLKDLAQLFETATGKKIPIEWGSYPYRDREVMMPWTKGVPVPGWKAKISLIDGIKRTFKDGND
jgi:CDP-paratose synthetase